MTTPGATAVAAGDQCALRTAIQQANFTSSADTITLPAGHYLIDKRSCGSARCDEKQAAEDDLDVKFPVTINGAGARSTIIDANSDEGGNGAPSTLQGIFEVTFSEPALFAVSGVTMGDTGTHLTITDSTISGNGQAGLDFEGGRTVPNGGSAITLRNSIVAANATVFDSIAHDCSSAPLTAGENLDGDGTCGTSKTGAPQLGALADNGGQTDTLLPAGTSPVVDAAADCASLTVDQRGAARPQGAACELGAVERAPSNAPGSGSDDGGSDQTGDKPGGDPQPPIVTPPVVTPPANHPPVAAPSKGRALGFYCKGESKKGLPAKKVKGMKKTPYALCVSGGRKLLADLAPARQVARLVAGPHV